MPKVSVIIPTYNYGKYIEKAIDSVLDQTYRDFEIIVVDDGSTDDTKEIIETKNNKKIRYFYQTNRGASAARNKGIAEARGEYFVFLDADDSFCPENLEKKLSILERNANAGFVYSDGIYKYSGKKKKSSDYGLSAAGAKLSGDIFLKLLEGYKIETSAVMLRAVCIRDVGGFDEKITALQDYDLFLRICSKYPASFIDECLFESVRHEDSLSQKATQIATYEIKARIIRKIEKNDHKKAELLGIKWKKIKAAADYFDGSVAYSEKNYNDACSYFLKSIINYPNQKRVYLMLILSFIRARLL